MEKERKRRRQLHKICITESLKDNKCHKKKLHYNAISIKGKYFEKGKK